MAKREPRMVSLGYGKFARADRIYALVPLDPKDRGEGRRTYVHVDDMAEPIVASRSERAILADVEDALTEAAGIPRRRRGRGRRGRRSCSSSRLTLRELLRHHPDLLRQRRAPPGPRLLDDRRRHPRPAPPPARRGRLLPDRHRRARRARHAAGRGGGRHAARARRPPRPSLQGDGGQDQRLQRLLHPDHGRGPHGAGPGDRPARLRQRPRLRGRSTRAGTARAARTSRPSRRSARTTPARSTRSR